MALFEQSGIEGGSNDPLALLQLKFREELKMEDKSEQDGSTDLANLLKNDADQLNHIVSILVSYAGDKKSYNDLKIALNQLETVSKHTSAKVV